MNRIVLFIGLVVLVAGCNIDETNNNSREDNAVNDVEQSEAEVLFDRENELIIYQDDNLKINLTKARQERMKSVQDFMKLMFVFENNTNRTYEFYFDEIQLDGEKYKITNISSTDNELKGNEELEVITVVDSLNEMSFDEYIGGKLIYKDYEGNRNTIEFGEYINE